MPRSLARAVVLVVLVNSDSFWMGYCFVKVILLGLLMVWDEETSGKDFREGDRAQRVGELELDSAGVVDAGRAVGGRRPR